jgi:hypothetical protein
MSIYGAHVVKLPGYGDAISYKLRVLIDHIAPNPAPNKLLSSEKTTNYVWSLWGLAEESAAHEPNKFTINMGFHGLAPCEALAPCANLEDIGKGTCQSIGVDIDIVYRLKQWSYTAKCCNPRCSWQKEERFGIDLPNDVAPFSILDRLHAQLTDRLNSRR